VGKGGEGSGKGIPGVFLDRVGWYLDVSVSNENEIIKEKKTYLRPKRRRRRLLGPRPVVVVVPPAIHPTSSCS
jgi:hypothetical protein